MSDLSFHVRQFVPNAEGEELELRNALLKARDYAAALRGRAASELACNLACEAHELAGAFAFAETSIPRLKMAVGCCRNLVQAAMYADGLAEGEA